MSTPTTTNNPSGAQGEKAAEEIKGGIKGLNNLSEEIRQNINSFADDLLGGHHNSNNSSNSHPSTGFSNDAKVAGKEVERKVGGGGGHATGQEVNDTTTTTTGTTGKTL